MPTEWTTGQAIAAALLCGFPLVGIIGIVVFVIVAKIEDATQRRNVRYIYKGAAEDGTPIFFAKPLDEK